MSSEDMRLLNKLGTFLSEAADMYSVEYIAAQPLDISASIIQNQINWRVRPSFYGPINVLCSFTRTWINNPVYYYIYVIYFVTVHLYLVKRRCNKVDFIIYCIALYTPQKPFFNYIFIPKYTPLLTILLSTRSRIYPSLYSGPNFVCGKSIPTKIAGQCPPPHHHRGIS